MNFCSNCGTPVKKDYKYCKKCGKRLAQNIETATAGPGPLSDIRDSYKEVIKGDKKLPAIIVVGLLLSLFIGYKVMSTKVTVNKEKFSIVEKVLPKGTFSTGTFKAPDDPNWGKQQQMAGFINGQNVFARTGPGQNYEDQGFFRPAEKVIILATNPQWYKVKRANGNIVWASAKYCKITQGVLVVDPKDPNNYLNGDKNCLYLSSDGDNTLYYLDCKSVKVEKSSDQACYLIGRMLKGKRTTEDGQVEGITDTVLKYEYTTDGSFPSNKMFIWNTTYNKYEVVQARGDEEVLGVMQTMGELMYRIVFHKPCYGSRSTLTNKDWSGLGITVDKK